MLHDIGTTKTNLNATRMSFEFHGGLLALNLLQEHGASKSQAESVCEAIIRHQDLGESGMIHSVGQLIQLATVFGESFSISFQIMSNHPKHGTYLLPYNPTSSHPIPPNQPTSAPSLNLNQPVI